MSKYPTERWRRAAATLPVVAALMLAVLAGGGCVDADIELTLNKDDSGLLEVEYSLAEETVSQIRAMLALKKQILDVSGGEPYDPREDKYTRLFLDPDAKALQVEIEKYKPRGVLLEEIKVESRNARRFVEFKASFANLARLAEADFFARHGFTLRRAANGDYRLARRHGVPVDPGALDAAKEDARLLAPLLAGFRVQIEINTPGRIRRGGNAMRQSLRSASWLFSFDRDPEAVAAFQGHRLLLYFDGTGLNLSEVTQTAPPGASG